MHAQSLELKKKNKIEVDGKKNSIKWRRRKIILPQINFFFVFEYSTAERFFERKKYFLKCCGKVERKEELVSLCVNAAEKNVENRALMWKAWKKYCETS